jgi:nicotinamide mononucleotide adenylyltransferase
MGTHHVVGGIVSPVHDSYGKKGLVSATHRLAMTKIGLQSSDWIRLSDWECQQDGWTPTRKSLEYHQVRLIYFCFESMETFIIDFSFILY